MGTRRTHVQGQSSMYVIVLNSQSKYETSKDEGNHIIHISFRNIVAGSNPEEGKEKEGRHGSDGHRNGLREPPSEHPRQNTQHVPAGGGGGGTTTPRTIKFYAQANNGAQ